MLDYKDFKQILDNTAQLTESVKTCPKDDVEEVQMRIDSNVHALQIMASKIEDPETKAQFKSIIESLSKSACFSETETTRTRRCNQRDTKGSELIDEELLRNSMQLRSMAKRFDDSLGTDRKVLRNVGDKMLKNSEESRNSLRVLEATSNSIRSTTILLAVLFLFFIMYFIIRFV